MIIYSDGKNDSKTMMIMSATMIIMIIIMTIMILAKIIIKVMMI